MHTKVERKFTLDEADIKAIVAAHLSTLGDLSVSPEQVIIHIKDSTPYGGGGDDGKPAVLTVTAVIEEPPGPFLLSAHRTRR
jgi:hypothetical protein